MEKIIYENGKTIDFTKPEPDIEDHEQEHILQLEKISPTFGWHLGVGASNLYGDIEENKMQLASAIGVSFTLPVGKRNTLLFEADILSLGCAFEDMDYIDYRDSSRVVITNASTGGTYPDNRIYSLNMQADGKIIASGTGYSAAGSIDFAVARYHSGLNAGIGTQEISDIDLHISPNPVTDKAIITFNLKEPGMVQAEVINTSGIIVAKITDEFYPAGEHQLRWDGAGLAAGIYIIKMAVGDRVYTGKLVKTR